MAADAAFDAPASNARTLHPAEPVVQDLLDAIGDPDCRRILEAIADEPMTAREVAEACGLSRSSAYRKLERLTDGGLAVERPRLRPLGTNASEFVRVVDDVAVSVTDDGLECSLTYRQSPSEPSKAAGHR